MGDTTWQQDDHAAPTDNHRAPQHDPRTAIPEVFTTQLLNIQSAVALLTSMVRDQALEIVELRKAVNMSAGIIVNTNTTSDKTLSVLTNSITAHNESLASIQMTLANDAT